MSSDSDNTPRWIVYVGGLASIATIIGVIIAFLAYAHPGASPDTGNPPPSTQAANGPNQVPTVSNSVSNGPGQPSSSGSSSNDIAGATSTIDTFCSYLNSGATQRAYNMTSSTYQNQHAIDQFTGQFSNMDLLHGGCIHDHAAASGSSVVVPLTINRIDISNGTTNSSQYTATLVRDAQNNWVIDSIQ